MVPVDLSAQVRRVKRTAFIVRQAIDAGRYAIDLTRPLPEASESRKPTDDSQDDLVSGVLSGSSHDGFPPARTTTMYVTRGDDLFSIGMLVPGKAQVLPYEGYVREIISECEKMIDETEEELARAESEDEDLES